MILTDHYFSEETLGEVGEVVKTINAATSDPDERHWAFMKFFAASCDGLFTLTLEPEIDARGSQLLESLKLSQVVWRPGRHQ